MNNNADGDTLFVVMPAYNECDNIGAVVAQWHAVVEKIGGAGRLLVVNDGSRDDTLTVLRALQHHHQRLTVLDKPNTGHGPTCLFAYRAAISAGAAWVFQTDSDGQTDPADFWEFWRQRGAYDFIIGYRPARRDGIARKIISLVLRLVVSLIFCEHVPDANIPFRLMRSAWLTEILSKIPDDIFLANVTVSVGIVKSSARCRWLPVAFAPRAGGASFVNPRSICRIAVNAVKDFWRVRKQLR